MASSLTFQTILDKKYSIRNTEKIFSKFKKVRWAPNAYVILDSNTCLGLTQYHNCSSE
jgi:hypothetical protein